MMIVKRHAPLAAAALAAGLALASCVSALPAPLAGRLPEGANAFQEDFAAMARYIRKTHAGFAAVPLRSMEDSAYEALVQETWDRLAGAEDELDWYFEVSFFLEKLGDGHTSLEAPQDAGLPLYLWWFEDGLYAVATSAPEGAALAGKWIISIGGKSVAELEALVNAYVPADRGSLGWKRLKSPALLSSRGMLGRLGLLDAEGRALVEYEEDGAARKALLGTSYSNRLAEQESRGFARVSATLPKPGNAFEYLEAFEALYLQLNSLPLAVDRYFLEAAFKVAKERGAKRLILDLRNNSGGNSAWCDEFLRYLVREPRSLYLYQGWESAYPGPNARRASGTIRVEPVTNGLGFAGELFVLTGPRTFSSATFFAVAVKDNGLGLLVGEPCGNTSIRYGFMATPIVLPRSGRSFATTKYVWGRAKPGVLGAGPLLIEPDLSAAPSFADYLAGRDPAFERLAKEVFGAVAVP